MMKGRYFSGARKRTWQKSQLYWRLYQVILINHRTTPALSIRPLHAATAHHQQSDTAVSTQFLHILVAPSSTKLSSVEEDIIIMVNIVKTTLFTETVKGSIIEGCWSANQTRAKADWRFRFDHRAFCFLLLILEIFRD